MFFGIGFGCGFEGLIMYLGGIFRFFVVLRSYFLVCFVVFVVVIRVLKYFCFYFLFFVEML